MSESQELIIAKKCIEELRHLIPMAQSLVKNQGNCVPQNVNHLRSAEFYVRAWDKFQMEKGI